MSEPTYVKVLEDRIDQLEAEVAQLRKDVDALAKNLAVFSHHTHEFADDEL